MDRELMKKLLLVPPSCCFVPFLCFFVPCQCSVFHEDLFCVVRSSFQLSSLFLVRCSGCLCLVLSVLVLFSLCSWVCSHCVLLHVLPLAAGSGRTRQLDESGSLSLSLSLSLFLSLYLSAYLSMSLSVSLSYLSPSIYLYLCLCLSPCLCLSVSLSITPCSISGRFWQNLGDLMIRVPSFPCSILVFSSHVLHVLSAGSGRTWASLRVGLSLYVLSLFSLCVFSSHVLMFCLPAGSGRTWVNLCRSWSRGSRWCTSLVLRCSTTTRGSGCACARAGPEVRRTGSYRDRKCPKTGSGSTEREGTKSFRFS